MDAAAIGNRIREIRESRGMTQEDLSAKTGVSIKHISVLERGLKEPKLSTFLNIADALELTPNELLSPPEDGKGIVTALSYKISKLPYDEQERLLKIVNTLIKEL